MDKPAWRKELLCRRDSLPAWYRRRAERTIIRSVMSLPEMGMAETIGLYADFRGEAATARLALLCCLAGKSLALPVADQREKGLVFRRVISRHQLHRGAYGIREPGPGCPPVSPRSLDLLVVPGVGFDRRGGRLGYGAGYYDRFLPLLRDDCAKIGLAFACQVVPLLPRGGHDVNMDAVVTEDGIIRPAAIT